MGVEVAKKAWQKPGFFAVFKQRENGECTLRKCCPGKAWKEENYHETDFAGRIDSIHASWHGGYIAGAASASAPGVLLPASSPDMPLAVGRSSLWQARAR
jgi:hypothetical protein